MSASLTRSMQRSDPASKQQQQQLYGVLTSNDKLDFTELANNYKWMDDELIDSLQHIITSPSNTNINSPPTNAPSFPSNNNNNSNNSIASSPPASSPSNNNNSNNNNNGNSDDHMRMLRHIQSQVLHQKQLHIQRYNNKAGSSHPSSARSRSPHNNTTHGTTRFNFPPHIPGSQYCLSLNCNHVATDADRLAITPRSLRKPRSRSRSPHAMGQGAGSGGAGGPGEGAGKRDQHAAAMQWFHDMESQLASVIALIERSRSNATGSLSTDNAVNNAVELQRVKYAMLISKLEEMNRLHRDVLIEERDKQAYAEFALQRDRLQRELAEKLQQKDEEHARTIEQMQKQYEDMIKQHEKQHEYIDKWSREKDDAYTELLKKLRDAQLQHEQQLASYKEQTYNERERERAEQERQRREQDKMRNDAQRQLELIMNDKAQGNDALIRARGDLEAAQRQILLLTEENVKLKQKLNDMNDRIRLVDSLEHEIVVLKRQRLEHDDEVLHLKKIHHDEISEMQHHTERLKKRIKELEDRDLKRSDMLQRQRLEGIKMNANVNYYSINRFQPEDFDCAWMSGPLDRSLISVPGTGAHGYTS